MKEISFGKVSMPLDQYAVQASAILGIRESGKSYTGTYIAERLMDGGVPIVAVDPIGIWRFLRVPGKGPGYPIVVIGGEHGDLPLSPTVVEATMRAAMQERVSVVFDLYDVHLSKRAWRDVMVKIVEVLLFENKKYGPRHIFVEEAAEFVPQKVGLDQGQVYDKMERLVRMGGNAQLGVTLINQRAEEVNKAVLELCDCLILHRQKGRRSLENLSKWLDAGNVKGAEKVKAEVPVLGNGHAFVWAGQSDAPSATKIPEKNTLHPDRRTPHAVMQTAEARSVDVADFVGRIDQAAKKMLGTAPEQKVPRGTKEHEGDGGLVDELRAQIQTEYRRGFGEGDWQGYERGYRAALEQLRPRISEAQAALEQLAAELGSTQAATIEHLPDYSQVASAVGQPEHRAAQQARNAVVHRQVDAAGMSPGELAVLRAVAMYQDGVDRDQLSILTGYKRSTRDKYVQLLTVKGRLQLDGEGRVKVTKAGIKALGKNYEPLPTGKGLREFWLNRLPEGERRIFERVIEAYPNEVDRGELSAHTGYKRSTRDKYLQHLQSRRIVEASGDGVVKASAVLFQ